MTRRQRGFTLIEVLVAIGIFALVSAMAYSGLNQILKARDRIDVERQLWRSLSLAFLRLEEDIYQARARTVRDIRGEGLPAFLGQPTDTRALGPPSMEFTRAGLLLWDEGILFDTVSRPEQPRPIRTDLQRVAYRLHEGVLWRQTWPVLDRAPVSKPLESPLLREVEEFHLRFFGADKTWQERWPRLGPGGAYLSLVELPRAVEVTLKLKGQETFVRVFLVNE